MALISEESSQSEVLHGNSIQCHKLSCGGVCGGSLWWIMNISFFDVGLALV